MNSEAIQRARRQQVASAGRPTAATGGGAPELRPMSVPRPATDALAENVPSRASARSADIHVKELSKRYGAFWALRDASFVIQAGEILGLIGPNGSGKTTLFRCLAGVAPATS